MKRDMNLVRKLLLIVENPEPHRPITLEIDYEPEASMPTVTRVPSAFVEVQYEGGAISILGHFEMLIEAGLLRGSVSCGPSQFEDGKLLRESFYFDDLGLTWKGHEFLDTVRSPEVWKRTQTAAQKIGGASLDVLMKIGTEIAVGFAKASLGL